MKNAKRILSGITLGLLLMGATATIDQQSIAYANKDNMDSTSGHAKHVNMMAECESHLKADVAAGKITQKEADQCLEQMRKHHKDMQASNTGAHSNQKHHAENNNKDNRKPAVTK